MDNKGSCPKSVQMQESQCTPNIYSPLTFSFMIKIFFEIEQNKVDLSGYFHHIQSVMQTFMFPSLTGHVSDRGFALSRVGFMGTSGLFSAAVFQHGRAQLSMARSITQYLTASPTTEWGQNKKLHNGLEWLSIS